MPQLSADYLRKIIRFTLHCIDMYSPEAEELLLATAAHESLLGRHLLQYPNGPARGLYQMEPATEDDIWINYIHYRKNLTDMVGNLTGLRSSSPLQLQFNPIYATVMARIHYKRIPEPLPPADNIHGMAAYWKKYYNTDGGNGSVLEFVEKYLQFAR